MWENHSYLSTREEQCWLWCWTGQVSQCHMSGVSMKIHPICQVEEDFGCNQKIILTMVDKSCRHLCIFSPLNIWKSWQLCVTYWKSSRCHWYCQIYSQDMGHHIWPKNPLTDSKKYWSCWRDTVWWSEGSSEEIMGLLVEWHWRYIKYQWCFPPSITGFIESTTNSFSV